MIKILSNEEKEQIIKLYREGNNCVQIKRIMSLKGHQQVLNVLNKLPDYIPYRNGRGSERKFTLNENYFKVIDTEEKAYILGLICADGHVDTKRFALRFSCQTLDKDILIKIKNELNSNQVIIDFTRDSNFSYGKRIFYHSKIQFCSKKLINTLISKSLTINKTYTLSSKVIEFVPNELIRHFLRGYFDGDGNVLFGKKYSSGIKYNINICGNLEFLENTFGKYFPTKNKYYKDKYSKQCWLYKLSSKENVISFLDYLYKDSKIYLNRKYEIYLISRGHTKQGELLGNPTIIEDNQQPSLGSNSFEGSETNSQIQTSNVEDSNANTSALLHN